MEDLIFIVLYIAIPVIILTMGFIAVLTKEERTLKGKDDPEGRPRYRN